MLRGGRVRRDEPVHSSGRDLGRAGLQCAALAEHARAGRFPGRIPAARLHCVALRALSQMIMIVVSGSGGRRAGWLTMLVDQKQLQCDVKDDTDRGV